MDVGEIPATQGDATPPAAPPRGVRAGRRAAGLLALYTGAVFLSAFLLFLVQPMFGRMVLPLLGGSPAVWNTCMLFFQTALLGGYLYAHLSSRWLAPRRQWALHLLLLAGAALALPLSTAGAAPQPGDRPIPWLLSVMLVAVGPPFLVLAATGPMLQRWFARSGHPDAAEPYHLYAASNLGSMLALLAYPLLLEPRLTLGAQSGVWAWGFLALALLLAGCGVAGWRRGGPEAAVPGGGADRDAVTWRERAVWVGLALIPSSLLLGVTTYITTDLTPAPFLWVLPLALYLLSFTLTFARRPPLPHSWMVAAQPVVVVGVVVLLLTTDHVSRPALTIPLHLAALFVTSMVCHGELARRRPPVRHLTEFYLLISVGGALGGAFNVLVAPVLFPQAWEYPLMLALACLARPWPRGPVPLRVHLHWGFRAAGFGVALLLLTGRAAESLPAYVVVALALGVVHLLAAALGRAPLWLTLCVGGVLAGHVADHLGDEQALLVDRSFFGQYRVSRSELGFHVLTHGSTLHGAQHTAADQRREPLTYYLREGPLGDVFESMGISTQPWRVAVVGLGTGTTAAYAQPGERWTFFELDPHMERIARDPRLFSYLADSPAPARVVLGDARLSLARDSAAYDLIVLDAFSSDAIPVHLLTREAMQVYLERLRPGGRIAIHISNRYLDLEPVVAALARDLGLAARVGAGPEAEPALYRQSSTWVVVARDEADLAWLDSFDDWRRARLPAGTRAWTDDYSSLWSALRL